MVATINSLPLELIRLILASACPLPLPDDHERWDPSERYDFLPATALVCSAWRSISQELLWEVVELESPASMAAFVHAPRLPIKTLRILFDDSEGAAPDLLEQIFDRVRGVRQLYVLDTRTADPWHTPVVLKLDTISVDGFKGELPRIRLDLILIARFADLKWLELQSVQVATDNPWLEIFPFDLERLSMDFDNNAHIPPSRLLAMICQPSITRLHLFYNTAGEPILHNFLPLAHQLRTLDLNPNLADDPFLPTFLRACGALQHLELSPLQPGWLEALPSPLVSLGLWHLEIEEAEALVELIKDGVVGVSKLQQLKVHVEELHGLLSGLPEDATEEGTLWRELAKICREKGIMIEEILYY
jgi:hypothetical protein